MIRFMIEKGRADRLVRASHCAVLLALAGVALTYVWPEVGFALTLVSVAITGVSLMLLLRRHRRMMREFCERFPRR